MLRFCSRSRHSGRRSLLSRNLLLPCAAWEGDSPTRPQTDAVWPFDIPSQSLPAALDAFAEQAYVQMLYKAGSVRDL